MESQVSRYKSQMVGLNRSITVLRNVFIIRNILRRIRNVYLDLRNSRNIIITLLVKHQNTTFLIQGVVFSSC